MSLTPPSKRRRVAVETLCIGLQQQAHDSERQKILDRIEKVRESLLNDATVLPIVEQVVLKGGKLGDVVPRNACIADGVRTAGGNHFCTVPQIVDRYLWGGGPHILAIA